jgi:hypothetical protein
VGSPEGGRFAGPGHAPGVQRSQRLRVGDQVSLGPLTLTHQQRVGQRSAGGQILYDEDAGAGIGAQQPRGDGHGHVIEIFQGGQFGPKTAGTAAVAEVSPALEHDRAVIGEMQADHMASAPDRLRGTHLGPLAPGVSQQRFGSPCLSR